MPDVSRETRLFLQSLANPQPLIDYHRVLATAGVERGLIGPREVERLWERHVLNCAVVVVPTPGGVPEGATVADVGSGAGLPGLVWAIVRPDLRVTLIEPLLRRSTFLSECVDTLGLGDRVVVTRARAEDLRPSPGFDVVTARAVAPMEKLLGWTLPLVRVGGTLLALKGASAAEELGRSQHLLTRYGGGQSRVVTFGQEVVDTPTTVVEVRRIR